MFDFLRLRIYAAGCVAAVLLVPAGWACAQTSQPVAPGQPPTPATQPVAQPYDLLTTPQLTGTWFGLRPRLEEMGISINVVQTTAFQQNFRGGLNTHHAHDFSGDLRVNLTFDLDRMGLLDGGLVFIRLKETFNEGVKADAGSLSRTAFVLDEGDESILVDKWWYRQFLLGKKIEFRIGKLLTPVDLFDNPVYARNPWSQFLNSTLNFNPTVPHTKTLGAYLRIQPVDWFHLHMVAADAYMQQTRTGFDTTFHGAAEVNGIWEAVLTPRFSSAHGDLPGNYRFGWWYSGRMKTRFIDDLGGLRAVQIDRGDQGGYLSFDQLVWKENAEAKDTQGIGLFLRYGFADRRFNKIQHFWSFGGQYEGILPGRDRDVLAFGVAQSILSSQYRHNVDARADRETVYELYYRIQVTPWCEITPDIQFITHPGGLKDARDALVGGVRVLINL